LKKVEMDKGKEALGPLFEQALGPDAVKRSDEIEIEGCKPLWLVQPGSKAEVAESLRICADHAAAVVPAGLMTWLESGNPVRRADVVLSLARLGQIVDYSPQDLTVTVQAGLPLGELNAAAGGHKQWLPLDPPGAANSSLGAVVACASSGPLRLGFGTPRDYVIGLAMAHADGGESKSGGRVVKNVAGYDMNKLYTGSFGTLGVLTELTFKLKPLPERSATLLVRSLAPGPLLDFSKDVLKSNLQPASLILTNRTLSGLLGAEGSSVLCIRFMDLEATVQYQLSRATEMTGHNIPAKGIDTFEGEDADLIWKRIADLDRLAKNVFRLSVPVSTTPEAFDLCLSSMPECIIAADAGTGILRVGLDADDDEEVVGLARKLRERAEALKGTLFIERASSIARGEADAWGDPGPSGKIMIALKERFDPQSILNPGKFVCGI
jgi:glycolate oxidase FAD binding subunit